MTPIAEKVDLAIPGKNEVILGFHDICDQFDWSVNSIRFEKFRQFAEILNAEKNGQVRFLFDDGFESIAILANSNPALFLPFRPALSIITSQIGGTSVWDRRPGGTGKNHINREQLRTLSESGWEIVSHTHSHLALDWLSPEQINKELAGSAKILEDIIGKPVVSLSFPFGRFNQKVEEIAIESGFTTFYSNRKGSNGVNRVYSVYRWDSTNQLMQKVRHGRVESARLKLINLFSAGTVWVQAVNGLYSEPKSNQNV
ncbi:MAG: polysaccharide deacetylase family protein [Bacteroidetes bacterium]|nr:polysaccharide deacetylase family protein [Bacteroidota bacterium]